MLGQAVCSSHGGRSRQARAGAAAKLQRQEAETIMASYAQKAPGRDPGETLFDLIAWAEGKVNYCRARVQQLRRDEEVWGVTKTTEGDVVVGNGPQASLQRAGSTTSEAKPNIWIVLLNEAEKQLQSLTVDAIKVGLKARELEIAAAQSERFVQLIDLVIRGLGHDPADPGTAAVVTRAFDVIEGGLAG